jgi:predicted porin
MKKHLIALAVVALTSQAHADVEVAAGLKLFGVLDQGFMRQSVSSASSTVRAYSNTGFFAASATSRFGVKGERDLSNGVKAVVQFEQELAPDDATLMPSKNRGTFVGIESADKGALKLGTQETPAYVMFTSDVNGRVEYKPQVWRFLAGSDTQDRANNAAKYTSPKLGPVTVDLMRGYGETNVGTGVTTVQTNEFKSLGVNFNQGPVQAKVIVDSTSNTALAYALPGEVNKGVLNTSNGTTQNKTTMIAASANDPLVRQFISLSYDLGIAKLNYIMGNAQVVAE